MFIFLFRVVHRNSFLPFWIGRKNFSPAFHDRTSFLLQMTWKKSEMMQSSLDSKLVIDTAQAAWMGAELSLLPPLKNMSCILIKLGYFYYLSPYVKICFILVLPPSCRYSQVFAAFQVFWECFTRSSCAVSFCTTLYTLSQTHPPYCFLFLQFVSGCSMTECGEKCASVLRGVRVLHPNFPIPFA